jgi:hypothetical protein
MLKVWVVGSSPTMESGKESAMLPKLLRGTATIAGQIVQRFDGYPINFDHKLCFTATRIDRSSF